MSQDLLIESHLRRLKLPTFASSTRSWPWRPPSTTNP